MARVTLDVDRALQEPQSEVHGPQPKTEWNGHYSPLINHLLINLIADTVDKLDAQISAGNIASADDALVVILNVVDRAWKTF